MSAHKLMSLLKRLEKLRGEGGYGRSGQEAPGKAQWKGVRVTDPWKLGLGTMGSVH